MASFEKSFHEAEKRALRFLTEYHAFRLERRDVTEQNLTSDFAQVTYVSTGEGRTPGGWRVILTLAPLRLELDVDITNGAEERYSFQELHQLMGQGLIPTRSCDLYEAMHNAEQLGLEFERLANILAVDGERFFSGDNVIWHELREQRARNLESRSDADIIRQSENAAQSKDWPRVIQLLGPIAERLSGAPKARLAYAEKRSRNAT